MIRWRGVSKIFDAEYELHTKDVVGLQISTRESGDVTILDLRGRSTIDGGESELLSNQLQKLVANGVRELSRGGPFFSLSLWSRLSASPFAIVFLLVLPNSFHIGISPAPEFRAVHCDLLRRPNLADRKPSVKSDPVDSRHLRRLLCGIGSH
jgi:hypothetical protein